MDSVIINGDQAVFDSSFPPATVIAPPGVITGTAKAKVNGLLACAEGDEASVVVPGAVYFTPSFPIPGAGTLTIVSLGADQKAQKASSDGRGLILRGSKFRARLQVNAPATVPSASGAVPDPTLVYNGTGSFITTNTSARAE
jgi:Contractile injection system spike tip protein